MEQEIQQFDEYFPPICLLGVTKTDCPTKNQQSSGPNAAPNLTN